MRPDIENMKRVLADKRHAESTHTQMLSTALAWIDTMENGIYNKDLIINNEDGFRIVLEIKKARNAQ